MIEPDDGVEGNQDLGRLFSLLIRGQDNMLDVLKQLQATSERSLHMAGQFSTSPSANQQASRARRTVRRAPVDPTAGLTTGSNLGDAHRRPAHEDAGFRNRPADEDGDYTLAPPQPLAATPENGGTPVGTPVSNPAGGPVSWSQNVVATMGNMRRATVSQLGQSVRSAVMGGWAGKGGGGTPAGTPVSNPGGGGPSLPPTRPQTPGRALPPNSPGGGLLPGGYTPGGRYGGYGPYGPYGTSGSSGPTGGGGGAGGQGSGPGGGGGPLGGTNSDPGDDGQMYGMNSGIGKWMRKNIPGVDLADKVGGEIRSQRDKNEYYQNIEGGSNTSGFGEREAEEGYAFSTQGVFSSQEARAAFKGVTRLGFNGRAMQQYSQQGDRQDALNFVYHGKTAYGASVNESLQQIEVASKNSTVNLQQFQKALKDISDTAGEAGVNAQMARGQLTTLLQTAMNAGYGSGSVTSAANIQMGQTTLGRSYQNIDLSGQMGQGFTYMAASNTGMTYNQYTAMQSTNPLAASQARAGENLALLSQIFTQQELNWVKQKAQAMGGKLDPNSALTLVPEFEQAFPNHNVAVIAQQLAAFGIVQSADPTEALGYAFNLIAGNNGDLANAQKTNASTKPMSLSAASKAAGDYNSLGGPMAAQAAAGLKTNPNLITNFTDQKTDPSIGNELSFGLFGYGGDSGALTQYKKGVASSKTRNPVIEGLLQKIKDPGDATVIVHTASGDRVVSLQDAIQNHPDELSSGDAQFVGGKEKGKSVSDLVGAGNTNPQDWSQEAAKSKDTSGQSLSDWQKANPTANPFGSGVGAGANGTVMIDLSANAQKLLTIANTTGIAASNAEGAPAVNSYSYNSTR